MVEWSWLTPLQELVSLGSLCPKLLRDIKERWMFFWVGLLPQLERAVEVRALLGSLYPDEPHADCHVLAIFRSVSPNAL